jgi:hypothetical protein
MPYKRRHLADGIAGDDVGSICYRVHGIIAKRIGEREFTRTHISRGAATDHG